ncbi:sugar-binding protein [Rathayibacter sp. Leaf296]|uniref:sugar-binding protein n=1 Tax=Rathayibacter sp. Leaf296 TaxID=1736327 RepID=UPI000703348D|nr:sugar-binding protein [Rathayibacter sp. Leaf296]KQQ08264.1 hypothetical protein ASF46_13120 [Rathayibacter sp. Leaf296]
MHLLPPGRRLRLLAGLAAAVVAVPLLQAVSAAPASALEYAPTPVVLSDFKDPAQWRTAVSGGASATFTIDPSVAVTGDSSGRLDASIPTGTVEVYTDVTPVDAAAFEVSMRSSDVDTVAVRLTDSTGQVHQQLAELDTAAPGWQTVRLEDFDSGPGYVSWGGADDDVWHGPITRVGFVIDPYGLLDGATTGTIRFDAAHALLPIPALGIVPSTVGNAFDAGEPVALGFVTTAQSLSWTVRDADGTEVESGSGSAASLDGSIPLGTTTPGWYQVDITAIDADGTEHTGGTDFSITEPFDFTGSDENRLAASSHFGGAWPLDSAPLLARAGFSASRDEAQWAATETVPGQFVWQEQVNAYQAELESLEVDQVQILDYGNQLYFPDEAPSTPADRQAFARYALASVDKFGTDDTVYEVWNEWNWRDLDGAAGGSASQYVELLKVVDEVVRAEHPDVTLIGPALAPMNDWVGWFREFAELGGLEYVDAVSTHPYTFPTAPEGSDRFEGHIDTLQGIMAEFGQVRPLYLTESGWPTGQNPQSVSESAQARYLTRAQLLALADGVEQFTIYDFVNDGLDPLEIEQNFGIVRNWADPRGAYAPKPAYVSNAVLARQIHDRPVERTEDLGAGLHDVVLDAGSGDEVHAVWSSAAASVLAFDTAGPVTVTDLYGARTTLSPDTAGRVYTSVGQDPVYVEGPIAGVATSSAFQLAVDAEIAGDPATGSVSVDPSAGAPAADFEVEAGGATTTGSAEDGTGSAPVAYPAQGSVGDRRYSATVSIGGSAVALLSTSGVATSPLTLTGGHALAADGSEALRLRVTNSSTRAVTVDGIDWAAGEASGTVLAGAVVPVGGTASADVPVAVVEPLDWTATLRRGEALPQRSSGELLPLVDPTAATAHPVVLDGVVDSALESLAAEDFLAEGSPPPTGWSGPADLSGSAWITHDAENVYLTARITDDVHAQPATGGDTWQGDGVQWGITAGATGESTRVTELGAALTAGGTVDVHRWSPTDVSSVPEGMVAEVRRDEAAKTTTYEIAVPWTTLRVDPGTRLLATTIAVNENDGAGRAGWLSWGLGVAESKNAALFRTVTLEPAAPEPAPTVDVAVTTRTFCLGKKPRLAVTATNHEAAAVSLRYSTPIGDRSTTSLRPGKATAVVLTAPKKPLAAGVVAVTARTTRDGVAVTQRIDVPYRAVTCR